MRSFLAAVSIRASKEQVWPILTDAAAYPEWNPIISKVEGKVESGGQLQVFPKDPYARQYGVVVEELAAPKKMVWKRGLPLGAFVSTRTFRLRTLKDGAVEFEMREVYSGWLSRWLHPMLPDPQRGFEIFAVALKQRAEATAVGQANPV
jgi:hypothetical protein